MSDTDTTHEGQADEASASGQVPGGERSYPEWLQGEPDVDRLVAYADNLRRERQELKDKASVWDDEEAAFEQIRERFPHWLEDDDSEEPVDDEYDDDEDPRYQKLSELEERQKAHDEWIARQEHQASLQAFNKDLDDLAAEHGVDYLDKEDRALVLDWSVKIGQEQKAWDRKATEKALQRLIARDERVANHRLEKVKSSKRAPHVSSGGQAGKGPQPDLSTEQGRAAFYAARLGGGPAT